MTKEQKAKKLEKEITDLTESYKILRSDARYNRITNQDAIDKAINALDKISTLAFLALDSNPKEANHLLESIIDIVEVDREKVFGITCGLRDLWEYERENE